MSAGPVDENPRPHPLHDRPRTARGSLPLGRRRKTPPPEGRNRPVPVALRLATVLALLTLVGTLLMMMPGVATRPLGFIEALFTAVSAVTVTGLSTITPATDLTTTGKVLLAVLIQIGGIGTMTLVVIIFRLLGRQITVIDRIQLRNALGGVETSGVLRLLGYVLLGVVVFEAFGTLLLYLNWRNLFPSDLDALGYAAFHAISTFCNAGFELFTGNPRFTSGIPGDGRTLLVISVLTILGGLGVPVIADVITYPRDRHINLHTRATVLMAVFLLVLGGLGIFASETLTPSPLASEPATAGASTEIAEEVNLPWTRRLALSFFHSAMARSAGLSTGVNITSLSPGSQFLMLLLMFIGAGPASMGGGINTGTAAVLALAVAAYARNRYEPTFAGRVVPWQMVQRASAVLVAALLVVTTATWLLLVSHPGTGLLIALFEVVSAFATCGLSLAFTGQLNTFGLAVIMVVMFWGRLGALTVVLALSRPASPPLVRYPEEQVWIG